MLKTNYALDVKAMCIKAGITWGKLAILSVHPLRI